MFVLRLLAFCCVLFLASAIPRYSRGVIRTSKEFQILKDFVNKQIKRQNNGPGNGDLAKTSFCSSFSNCSSRVSNPNLNMSEVAFEMLSALQSVVVQLGAEPYKGCVASKVVSRVVTSIEPRLRDRIIHKLGAVLLYSIIQTSQDKALFERLIADVPKVVDDALAEVLRVVNNANFGASAANKQNQPGDDKGPVALSDVVVKTVNRLEQILQKLKEEESAGTVLDCPSRLQELVNVLGQVTAVQLSEQQLIEIITTHMDFSGSDVVLSRFLQEIIKSAPELQQPYKVLVKLHTALTESSDTIIGNEQVLVRELKLLQVKEQVKETVKAIKSRLQSVVDSKTSLDSITLQDLTTAVSVMFKHVNDFTPMPSQCRNLKLLGIMTGNVQVQKYEAGENTGYIGDGISAIVAEVTSNVGYSQIIREKMASVFGELIFHVATPILKTVEQYGGKIASELIFPDIMANIVAYRLQGGNTNDKGSPLLQLFKNFTLTTLLDWKEKIVCDPSKNILDDIGTFSQSFNTSFIQSIANSSTLQTIAEDIALTCSSQGQQCPNVDTIKLDLDTIRTKVVEFIETGVNKDVIDAVTGSGTDKEKRAVLMRIVIEQLALVIKTQLRRTAP